MKKIAFLMALLHMLSASAAYALDNSLAWTEKELISRSAKNQSPYGDYIKVENNNGILTYKLCPIGQADGAVIGQISLNTTSSQNFAVAAEKDNRQRELIDQASPVVGAVVGFGGCVLAEKNFLTGAPATAKGLGVLFCLVPGMFGVLGGQGAAWLINGARSNLSGIEAQAVRVVLTDVLATGNQRQVEINISPDDFKQNLALVNNLLNSKGN